MQRALINKLYTILQNQQNAVYLTADNGTDYDVLLFSAFPDQCLNMGIAEENMVAAASGMALCGKIPIVCSAGAFLVYRAYEFIRNDVCFQNQNVKLIALGSGLSISALGPTHHTTEDIAALRAIPNLTILSVSTPLELEGALDYAMKIDGPVYLRLGMRTYGEYHTTAENICLNGIHILRSGKDALVFVTGDMVHNVMTAAEILCENHNISIQVAEVIQIKPLDSQIIANYSADYQHIFCVEEHNVIGGLGEIIASALNAFSVPAVVHKIGITDTFVNGYGSQSQLQAHNALSVEDLCDRILSEVQG